MEADKQALLLLGIKESSCTDAEFLGRIIGVPAPAIVSSYPLFT